MKIISLLSGGLDSTVLLYDLLAGGHSVKTLSANYGQRHYKEIEFAVAVAEGRNIEHEIVDLRDASKLLSGSSLISQDIRVPDGHYEEESMKSTVVPNRNMIMLSLAAGWAISSDFDAVAYAAHSGDHAIYPDCRPEFVAAMAETFKLADWRKIQLITPFLNLTKGDIVRRGAELDVPFARTWSCYKGEAVHCGTCGTCVERREAFQLASIQDPTEYADMTPIPSIRFKQIR